MKRLAFAVAMVIGLGFAPQAIAAQTTVSELLKAVDQKLASTNSPATSIEDRGAKIQRLEQQIAVADAQGLDKSQIYWSLSYLYVNGGDYGKGVKYRSMAADTLAPSAHPGKIIVWNAQASWLCAENKDFACAERHLDKARTTLSNVRSDPSYSYSTYSPYWKAYIDRAEALADRQQGKYAKADELYVRSIDDFTRMVSRAAYDKSISEVPGILPSIKLERAVNMTFVGREVEGQALAIEAIFQNLERDSIRPNDLIYQLNMLSSLLVARNDFQNAKLVLEEIVKINKQVGFSETSAQVLNASWRLAQLSAFQSNWTEADKYLSEVPTDKMTTTISALILFKAGKREEAARVATIALNSNTGLGSKHYETALARSVLALTQPPEQAQPVFAETVPILLSPSRQSNDDTTGQAAQDLIRQIVLEKYLDFASPVEGFVVAEGLRARSVQSSIASSSLRSGVPLELADLIRKEQDAEKQIAALNGLLLNAVSSNDNKVAEGLRTKIDKLRDERGSVAIKIETQFPSYAEMMRPKPVNIADIQTLLHPDEAMVSIYVGRERSYVWAIPKTGEPSFAKIPLSSKKVSEQVAALRSALDPNVARVNDVPAFNVEGSYRLYQSILGPVEKGWIGAKNLVVITNGALGYFPFGLFPTQDVKLVKANELFAEYRKVPWLIKTHTVTMTPSTSAFKAIRTAKPASQSRSFAGFGDPIFQAVAAPEAKSVPVVVAQAKVGLNDYPLLMRSISTAGNLLPPLPDTREEILAIARVLNADLSRDVFLGADASLTKVRATPLSDYRVVEFATHGLTAGELGLAQPALALSGGEFLTVNDILQLKLNADWVVLSACNTAAAGEQGAEAISGLGSAFFYSGAKSLLVTNWPVQSASAAKLTTELFRLQAEQPSVTRAEALQKAMLSVLDKGMEADAAGKPAFTYAHPLFWAPFSLVGEGG